MATSAVVNGRAMAPPVPARRGWARVVAAGVAMGMAALLVGDRGLTANAVQGIDPLEILNLQVKPNVVFVVDTSAQMGFNPEGTLYLGGDDPHSRLYQAKQALRELIAGNDGKANFGIIDLNANQAELALSRTAPLVYVADPRTPSAGTTWASGGNGRFRDFGGNFLEYDGSLCIPNPPITPFCSEQIFKSFYNDTQFASPYQGRFYMLSRLLRNGVRYVWDPTPGLGTFRNGLQAIDTTITCQPPPPGLLGDDADEFNDGTEPRACFEIENADVPGEIARYYLTSFTYGAAAGAIPECDGNGSAGGRCLVAPVPACTAGSNVPALLAGPLRLQIPLDAAGLPGGVPVTPVNATTDLISFGNFQPAPAGGIQLGQRRPLDNALRAAAAHYTGVVFPNRPGAVAGLQRNFVVVITSGRDNFGGGNPVATAAAMRGASTPPAANDITTMVVTINAEAAFPTSPDKNELDALQNAGTLGRRTQAFGAATAEQLKRALNFAFSEAIATGTFSTESSITESIYEYAALAGPFDPLDPVSRYRGRVPVLLQSSFDMPGFDGHLKAFINQGGVSTLQWDAGIRLLDRVWNGAAGNDGICPGVWTYSSVTPGTGPTAAQMTACAATKRPFADLRGTDPTSGSRFRPTGSLKRRIFTTRSNGVFPYDRTQFGASFRPATEQCPVPIWPPSASTSLGTGCPTLAFPVAPNDDTTPGLFDNALGIGAKTLAELQSEFGACLGSPLPTACTSLDPAIVRQRALREAREIILAFTGGAQVSRIAGVPERSNPAGDILYQARNWVLAESSLGVPAVVPPPLEARPTNHTAEYLLFRDGVRNNSGAIVAEGSAAGFGLRNPDKNANVPTGNADGTGSNGLYEPLMSTVYHAANDMLHAFRGGPCPGVGGTCSIGGVRETGGEELYGFVPYDQLPKLPERMQAQGRVPHTFMLASSVRFTDVFVPGNWTDTNTGRAFLGIWRTILVIGRGIAGQHYTAVDITAPGQLSRASLDSVPPFSIWSRGNPDVQDGGINGGQPGTTPGAANSLLDIDNGDEGANDQTAYSEMGETWSVPAMGAVPPIDFFGSEFAMFMGSGFSPTQNPNEGKTFYAMDALTGDVLFAPRAPDSNKNCSTLDPNEICPVPNALVANPAAYVAVQLAPGFVGNPAASTASLVYFGDLHGRMWKFMTGAPGSLVQLQPTTAVSFPPFNTPYTDSPDQPIGSSAALLNLDGIPHVYWETGNDLRVLPPENFRFVAMADVGSDVNPPLTQTDPLARKFVLPLDNVLAGFRGTAQPATAFNASQLGRVFFIGTRFTDQDVPGGTCRSRFDSVLFAVGAITGNAVYDLDSSGAVTASDRSVMLSGTKVNALRGSMGQIVLDKGDIGTNPPPAPPAPSPAPTANEGSSGEVIVNKIKAGSAVCR